MILMSIIGSCWLVFFNIFTRQCHYVSIIKCFIKWFYGVDNWNHIRLDEEGQLIW